MNVLFLIYISETGNIFDFSFALKLENRVDKKEELMAFLIFQG